MTFSFFWFDLSHGHDTGLVQEDNLFRQVEVDWSDDYKHLLAVESKIKSDRHHNPNRIRRDSRQLEALHDYFSVFESWNIDKLVK